MIAAIDIQTFAPLSGKHAAVVAAMAIMSALMLRVCRRARPGRGRQLDVAMGTMALTACVIERVYDLLRENASLNNVLPLHWCDVTGMIAVVALFAPQYRTPRTLLHFWGLCICSLAFLLPAVTKGPAYVDFWRFWITHAAIVLAALYDVGVRQYRPTRNDALVALAVAGTYAIALMPINAAINANYGYVGPKSFGILASLDRSLAWHGRVVALLGMQVVAMLSLFVATRMLVRLRRQRQPAEPLLLESLRIERATERTDGPVERRRAA